MNKSINININPNYQLIKQEISNNYQKQTLKTDEKEKHTGYIEPPVQPSVTKYVIETNSKIRSCSQILSEDLILQDYIFQTEDDELLNQLDSMWDTYSKYQLSLAVYDRQCYGYGCCEVVTDLPTPTINTPDDTRYIEPKRLEQFPARTARVKKSKNKNGEPVYYLCQLPQATSGGEKKLRLIQYLDKYDEKDNDLPIAMLVGGSDNETEFYSLPDWYSEINNLLAKTNLDLLVADIFNEGNQINGLLLLSGPPQRPNSEGETPQSYLRKQIRKNGVGNVIAYIENPDDKIQFGAEYININNNNWDYIESFSKSVDDSVLACYRIPRERFMCSDVKESMNSQKSATIWEIYEKSLNYRQTTYELMIREFNKIFFGVDIPVDIATPIFTDKKDIELSNTLSLFNSGLLTLKQALMKIESLNPDLDWKSIDYDAPYMDERFLNGNLMSLNYNNKDDTSLDDDFKRILGLL